MSDARFTKVFLDLLFKDIGGVEMDEKLLVFWMCMYDRREYFRNDRETLDSLTKAMNMDRFAGKRRLGLLIKAGVVKAELVVKNKGVKKGNEDKAPKRWRFIEIANPESYIKTKPTIQPKPAAPAAPVVPVAPATTPVLPQQEYNVYEDLEDGAPF